MPTISATSIVRSSVLLVAAATPAQDLQQPAPKVGCAIVGASVSRGMPWKQFEAYSPDPVPITFAESQLGREISQAEYDLRTDSVGLKAALQAVAGESRIELTDRSDVFIFQKTVPNANRQLRYAVKHGPLILGVDLLMCFGYGMVAAPPMGLSPEEARAFDTERRYLLQASGFELIRKHLTGNDCVLIVGDYPDLHDANKLVLPAHMRPSKAALAELNRRLAAFAKKHERVHVYPLSDRLERARARTLEVEVGGQLRCLGTHQVIQLDNMHTNAFGGAYLAHDVAAFVRRVAPELSECLPKETSFEQIVKSLDRSLDVLGEMPVAVKASAVKSKSDRK